jgi:hypothetical protein
MLSYSKLEQFPLSWYDDLIRIGNISSDNANHYFHALFFGYKSFRDMEFEHRIEYIKKERARIADEITLEEWQKYGTYTNGAILKLYPKIFSTFINEPHNKIFQKIVPNLNDVCIEIFDSIVSDDDNAKQFIFSEFLQQFTLHLDDIEKHEQKIIEKTKKLKCIELFQKFITHVWNQSEKNAFHDFIESIRNENTQIEIYSIPLLLAHINAHVFFIDAELKDVISFNEYYEELLSRDLEQNIVLYFHSPFHFESIGVMNILEDNNVMITRLLYNDHPFIQKCRERFFS